MFYVLIILLAITFVLPIISKEVERNLELFLFVVGISAAITADALNRELLLTVVQNKFMYTIVFAVLIGGFLFKALSTHVKGALTTILKHIPLKLFVFLLISILGLLSSVITAIIASLLLVEIISILPISRKHKININIISCFSIGLGAVLTPIGEPLATIVVSKLDVNFWFLLEQFGIYIIPGILVLGIIDASYAKEEKNEEKENEGVDIEETNKTIAIRGLKIVFFIIALDLLGEGFKPIIDTYIIGLDTRYLYWINISSVILDNATLIPSRNKYQNVRITSESCINRGLLISGGMMIPGNIPNIISAGKLKIKSSEWIKFGVPLGLVIMIVYYVILFII